MAEHSYEKELMSEQNNISHDPITMLPCCPNPVNVLPGFGTGVQAGTQDCDTQSISAAKRWRGLQTHIGASGLLMQGSPPLLIFSLDIRDENTFKFVNRRLRVYQLPPYK